MNSIVVMKFGSSVLADETRISAVIDEIYRALRRGERVVAVVSALGATTNRLVEDYGDDSASAEGHATYVGTGELQSAALLSRELRRSGVSTTLADAARLRLITEGGVLNAAPVALDVIGLTRLLEAHHVVVVPGFLGRDRLGRTTLLGRGGSDLSAVFLAAKLAAPCILLKDVDGIYEEDPALADTRVPQFKTLSWQTALEIGGAVVQRKALEWALEHETTITVRSLGGTGTQVGSFQDTLEQLSLEAPEPLRVGLIGLGTVGTEVYRRIQKTPELLLSSVLVRDTSKRRSVSVERGLITQDIQAFFAQDYDLIVDCSNPCERLNAELLQSLSKKVRVVTANKGNLADDIESWSPWIKRRRVKHSAAVGGVVTMLESLRELEGTTEVTQFRAVLNGTCNFILDELHRGQDFASALQTAQELGLAEEDPSADIDGWDAARKAALLVLEAWGHELSWRAFDLEGIRSLGTEDAARAAAAGAVLRLVVEGKLEEGQPRLTLAPQWVPKGSPEANVSGADNCLTVHGSGGKVIECHGAGAGGLPTAVSVFGDILSFLNEEGLITGRGDRRLLWNDNDHSNTEARQSR